MNHYLMPQKGEVQKQLKVYKYLLALLSFSLCYLLSTDRSLVSHSCNAGGGLSRPSSSYRPWCYCMLSCDLCNSSPPISPPFISHPCSYHIFIDTADNPDHVAERTNPSQLISSNLISIITRVVSNFHHPSLTSRLPAADAAIGDTPVLYDAVLMSCRHHPRQ
jgi:hypothetical protein